MKAAAALVASILRPEFRNEFLINESASKQQASFIDFEKSIITKSAFERAASASFVSRAAPHVATKLFRKLCGPSASVTRSNIRQLLKLIQRKGRAIVLVIGGGTIGNGLDGLYRSGDIDMVAFDIYASQNTHFIADAHAIPLMDGSCDAVVVQAVLEHVLSPSQVVAEIGRVLKPDGIVYAETPFLQHVHEGPYDFTRFTHSGHRWLFRDFSEIAAGPTKGVGTQLLWSIDYFARGVFRSKLAGKLIRLPFFWLRFFDDWVPEAFNIDGASGSYFLGRKGMYLPPYDMVKYYRGTYK